MKDIASAAWNWLESKLGDAVEAARYVIFGCIGIIILMWLINIWWNPAVNGIFGFIGLVLVVFLTISPKILQPTAAFTGLLALVGKQNPVRGTLAGPQWAISVARSFLYGFLFFATFLTFWHFENSPFAFWGIFLLAMMLFIWRERYGSLMGWMKWIEWSYIMICGTVLLWSTFNGSWQGEAFDKCTGEPLYLVDPKTGTVHQELEASDCDTPAYSPETGEPLRAMTADQAMGRNPITAPQSLADKLAGIKSSLLTDKTPSCPTYTQTVEHGARVTVSVNCPVKLDQRNMRGGFDFVLVDPVLRAQTGNQQLVAKSQERDSDLVTLFANTEGYKRVGRESIEVELYRKGTGAEEVAKRHGTYTPPLELDLTPAT